jgi:superfamily I DNA/RNA helicase
MRSTAHGERTLGGRRSLILAACGHGPETVIDAVRRVSDERYASLIISTAHRAKGREWDTVQIAGDFREPKKDPEKPEELPEISPPKAMLAYVAVTRANSRLTAPGWPGSTTR